MKKQKENKQKGITLIALIITIIVMLILVGVSVSAALNGGLFKTAKQATSQTEERRYEEQALADGKVKIDGEWYNSIEEYVNRQNIPEELKKYVLGSELAGRPISDIYSNEEFKDDTTTDENETQTVPIVYLTAEENEDATERYVYGKYNNVAYRIAYNLDTNLTIPEKTRMIYTPEGREGQDLGEITGDNKYNGWTILYDYGNKVEAVAPFTSGGTLTLGSSNVDETIESYNNAITLINNYVKADTTTYNGKPITYYTQDGTTRGVRSVGTGADPTGDKDVYKSSLQEMFGDLGIGSVGKKGDITFELDLVRMAYHSCVNITESYWISSRLAWSSAMDDYYCIRMVSLEPVTSRFNYLYDENCGNPFCSQRSTAVRPIITLENL